MKNPRRRRIIAAIVTYIVQYPKTPFPEFRHSSARIVATMDMSGMDMGGMGDMGSMSTGQGPGLVDMQKVYWALVAGAIAFAAASNILFKILYWQR